MTLETMKATLAEIDDNIRQGERYEAHGYECQMMLYITKKIRDELAAEIARTECDL